jgi:hypothetical protein
MQYLAVGARKSADAEAEMPETMEVEGVECLLFYLEVNKKMKPKNS